MWVAKMNVGTDKMWVADKTLFQQNSGLSYVSFDFREYKCYTSIAIASY